jgi:predicted HicB family RNase H-like nuclease
MQRTRKLAHRKKKLTVQSEAPAADAAVRIPRSLHERAKIAAIREKRTLSALVVLAVEAYLRKVEKTP